MFHRSFVKPYFIPSCLCYCMFFDKFAVHIYYMSTLKNISIEMFSIKEDMYKNNSWPKNNLIKHIIHLTAL